MESIRWRISHITRKTTVWWKSPSMSCLQLVLIQFQLQLLEFPISSNKCSKDRLPPPPTRAIPDSKWEQEWWVRARMSSQFRPGAPATVNAGRSSARSPLSYSLPNGTNMIYNSSGGQPQTNSPQLSNSAQVMGFPSNTVNHQNVFNLNRSNCQARVLIHLQSQSHHSN